MATDPAVERREEITAVIFSAQQETAELQTPDIPDDVYWLNLAAGVYLALDEGGYLTGRAGPT